MLCSPLLCSLPPFPTSEGEGLNHPSPLQTVRRYSPIESLPQGYGDGMCVVVTRAPWRFPSLLSFSDAHPPRPPRVWGEAHRNLLRGTDFSSLMIN